MLHVRTSLSLLYGIAASPAQRSPALAVYPLRRRETLRLLPVPPHIPSSSRTASSPVGVLCQIFPPPVEEALLARKLLSVGGRGRDGNYSESVRRLPSPLRLAADR